jgi:soluble lytic murein transglycosylase-like protein
MLKTTAALAGAAMMAIAAPAHAAVSHTIVPGETLWGIAVQSNLTTAALAAFNGLSPESQVIAGTTILVPAESEAAAALAEMAAEAPAAEESQAPATPTAGSHVVQWGETLTGIAAAAGVTTEALAAANGLYPARILLAGSTLTVPATSTTPSTSSASGEQTDAYATAVTRAQQAIQEPSTEPIPTPGRVTAEEVAGVATAHGVDPSLASAVAWHESGFENGLVSDADARGVMQILPSTWEWIKTDLAPYPLNPATPHDNVHAGVLFLRHLLDQTGGDQRTAAAGYYQGLGSVWERGMYEDTEDYVANVMALRPQFGG